MRHIPLPGYLSGAEANEILNFLIGRANIYAFNARDLKTFAHECGVRADNLSRHIREGRFPVPFAEKIEAACGRHFVRWEWLVNPVLCMENGEIY